MPERSQRQFPSQFGAWTLERRLSEHEAGGCGFVRGPGGTEAFARWERRAVRADARCGPEREYEALVALGDTALPRPLDLVRVQGWVACVQERVPGIPLSEAGPGAARGLARTLARVHARCRALGWVHGDLKPENVLVVPGGRIVILDWELARRTGELAAPGTLEWAPSDATAPRFAARVATDADAITQIVREFEPGAAVETDPSELLACISRTAVNWAACGADTSAQSHGAWNSLAAAAFDRWRDAAWCDDEARTEMALHVLRLVHRVNAEPPAQSERCILVRVARSQPRPLILPGDVRRAGARGPSPDVVRRVASVALGLTEVGADVIARVIRSGPRSPAGVLECLTVAASGVVQQAHLLTQETEMCAGDRVADDEPAESQRLVDGCSDALRRSDVYAAYRVAVRVTSRVLGGEALPPPLLKKLGETWLELAHFDAAMGMAQLLIVAGDVADGLCLRGRALSAAGDEAGLVSAIERIESAAQTAEQVGTALRLRASVEAGAGRVDAARRMLARVRPLRAALGPQLRTELALTRASLLRSRGKREAACRVLERAEQVALAIGAPRLGISCRVNRLLTDRREPRGVRADRWMTAAIRARDLGFRQFAAAAGAMAAGICLEVQRLTDAQRMATLARTALARGNRDLRESGHVVRIEAALADWSEGDPELTMRDAPASVPGDGERHDVLRLECGVPVSRLLSNRTDGARWRRALATAARVPVRIWSPARTWATARSLRDAQIAGRGLDVHAMRVLVRTVSTDWDEVLKVARSSVGANEAGTRFVLALTAFLVVWRQELAAEHLHWLIDQATSSDADRPIGVRRWEWRLAHAAARNRLRHGSVVAEWSEVATPLAEFAARLPAPLRATFGAISPVRRVLHWAYFGTVPPAGVSPSSPSRSDPLAADVELLRSAAVNKGPAASSLQRLLDCALRLNTSQSVNEALTAIVESLLDVCCAERAVVLFGNSGELTHAKLGTSGGVADISVEDAEISRSVLARARDSGAAILLDDARSEELLVNRPSIRRYQPRSLMVCALRSSTRHVGYIYVENRTRAGSFGDPDVQILEGFAAQAALALENAALVEDLRTSYRQVSEARAEAVRAESLRVLGRLASEVAHDLNNLLTAILGEAQLLSGDPTLWRAHGSLRVIERAAQDGAEVIRRIQDSTRRKPASEHADVDVGQVLEETLRLARVRVAAQGGHGSVRVVAECAPGLVVRGIPSELREVFTNLVNNALDAMPSGGTLHVAAARDGRDVRVTIADTGVGIAPDVLARMFEPFFTTKGARGNGLGLSIARGIARRHGGDIEIRSEPGVGTRVLVTLPREGTSLALPGAVPIEARTNEPPRTASPGDRRRFLIVDDDASVLRVLGQMLEQCGVVVDSAVGGDAALTQLATSERPYDLVLTDLYMPRISGLDVASEAQRKLPGTPVIIMSGCATSLESDAARKCGAVGFLRKPFTLDAVRGLARA